MELTRFGSIDKRISDYTGEKFYNRMCENRIPDVVPYIQNTFECLQEAELSRKIVEDISNQIIQYRRSHREMVSSVPCQVGNRHVDGRAFAQRNIREWCEYISKINDSLCHIINIILEFEIDPWDLRLPQQVRKFLAREKDSQLVELCESFREKIKIPQAINNYSKHNRNIWGREKVTPKIFDDVEYYLNFDSKDYSATTIMSIDNEADIAECVLDILDYLVLKIKDHCYSKRYYVIDKAFGSYEPTESLQYTDILNKKYCISAEFAMETTGSKENIVTEVKITLDAQPIEEVLLAYRWIRKAMICNLYGLGILECNVINVYREDHLIGKYVCDNENDLNASYFHFRKYRFISV